MSQRYCLTLAPPIILGNSTDEHPSGLCPSCMKGVWNVAYNNMKCIGACLMNPTVFLHVQQHTLDHTDLVR